MDMPSLYPIEKPYFTSPTLEEFKEMMDQNVDLRVTQFEVQSCQYYLDTGYYALYDFCIYIDGKPYCGPTRVCKTSALSDMIQLNYSDQVKSLSMQVIIFNDSKVYALSGLRLYSDSGELLTESAPVTERAAWGYRCPQC